MQLKNIIILGIYLAALSIHAMDNIPKEIKHFSSYGISLHDKNRNELPVTSELSLPNERNLLEAAMHNDVQEIERLVKWYKTPVNRPIQGESGTLTPLLQAANYGNVAATKKLLELKANPNLAINLHRIPRNTQPYFITNYAPLHAVCSNHTLQETNVQQVIELLLQYNANATSVCIFKDEPVDAVDMAVTNKYFSAAEQLYQAQKEQLAHVKLPFYSNDMQIERNTITVLKKMKAKLGDFYILKLKKRMWEIHSINKASEKKQLEEEMIQEINDSNRTKEEKAEIIRHISCFKIFEPEERLKKKIAVLTRLEEEVQNSNMATLQIRTLFLGRSGRDITNQIFHYAEIQNSNEILDCLESKDSLVAREDPLYISYKTVADLIQCIIDDGGEIRGGIILPFPAPTQIINRQLFFKDGSYVHIDGPMEKMHYIFHIKSLLLARAKQESEAKSNLFGYLTSILKK